MTQPEAIVISPWYTMDRYELLKVFPKFKSLCLKLSTTILTDRKVVKTLKKDTLIIDLWDVKLCSCCSCQCAPLQCSMNYSQVAYNSFHLHSYLLASPQAISIQLYYFHFFSSRILSLCGRLSRTREKAYFFHFLSHIQLAYFLMLFPS